jgi:hypothetical protein
MRKGGGASGEVNFSFITAGFAACTEAGSMTLYSIKGMLRTQTFSLGCFAITSSRSESRSGQSLIPSIIPSFLTAN